MCLYLNLSIGKAYSRVDIKMVKKESKGKISLNLKSYFDAVLGKEKEEEE